MAIQQVGGRGVYVITGSGRDPRKTSNGQSWADLVTQQKWMLIQQAQKDALRQIDREVKDYEARQQAYAQSQEDIRKQISDTRGAIEGIRLKEKQAQSAQDKELLKAQIDRARGRKSTTTTGTLGGGGGGGRGRDKRMSSADFGQYIAKQRQRNQEFATKTMDEVKDRGDEKQLRDLIQQRRTDAFTSDQQNTFDALDPMAQSLINNAVTAQREADRLTKVQNQFETARTQNNPTEMRRLIDVEQGLPSGGEQVSTDSTSTGGSRTTTERYIDTKELPTPDAVDYSELTTPLEERMRQLEQQLIGMKAPTAPDVNEARRTRQVASEDYGLDSSYQPEPAPAPAPAPTSETKMAMDILGATPTEDPTLPYTPFTSEQGPSGVVEADRPRESLGGLQSDQFEFKPSQAEIMDESFNVEGRIQPQQNIFQQAMDRLPSTQGIPTGETPLAIKQGMTTPVGNIRQLLGELTATPQEPSLTASFDPVKFGTANQKKQVAIQLLMQKAKELGPTNPVYLRLKDKVINQLERVLDPKVYKQQKIVEKNQSQNRGDYYALSKEVRGLQEKNAQLVYSLFGVNEETKLEDADNLYKSAQKQIKTNISDKSQQKKSQEFLDLMYLAYMNEK